MIELRQVILTVTEEVISKIELRVMEWI